MILQSRHLEYFNRGEFLLKVVVECIRAFVFVRVCLCKEGQFEAESVMQCHTFRKVYIASSESGEWQIVRVTNTMHCSF